MGAALLEVALLGGPGVVVGEGVDADDRATASAERLDQMRADEAGAARDQIGAARPQIVARRGDQRAIPETARQLGRKRVEGVVVDEPHAVGPRRRRAFAARPPPNPRGGRLSRAVGTRPTARHRPAQSLQDDRQVWIGALPRAVADVPPTVRGPRPLRAIPRQRRPAPGWGFADGGFEGRAWQRCVQLSAGSGCPAMPGHGDTSPLSRAVQRLERLRSGPFAYPACG